MNRRIPTILRSLSVLGVLAVGLGACAVYPAGGGYGYRHGGWRAAPPAYAHAAPRPHWGGGGWGGRGWGGGGYHRHGW